MQNIGLLMLWAGVAVARPANIWWIFPRQYTRDTLNQLTDGTPCRDVTVIYARGTTQDGNVGDAMAVGPLFFNALAADIGESTFAVQGVTYTASILGFLAGVSESGSVEMANLVTQVGTTVASRKCCCECAYVDSC
jgi:cutinase